MAYIRVKKISNKPYAYLVESQSTKRGPRQRVKQYLGRVHTVELQENVESVVSGKTKKEFLQGMVVRELKRAGFTEKGKKFSFESLHFCPQELTLRKKNKKEAILKLNEGYLCSFTVDRLHTFAKSKDVNKDGLLLAKYFLESGLTVNEEEFVQYYQML
ncbi:hypothetical protein HOD05_01095 [Candidatus Woesearchaeota archaeon]|jgi:hypothetical protein|nr:hypothetical protein [Candidatus Woesearchaeota archaeon]MBT4151003.1 hypothetical protein [Candidatus Woesearchaeota archaeon]MBT4247228.1 hypothetical protein [Candidatus Woesearchaeota archaeon]MBT4433793.1 hypothetical protein [Candidatus Woesearchaeota archaeon]MBT7332208.1 hypothetical protein [Candidatus Woesearchaeota archaeon]